MIGVLAAISGFFREQESKRGKLMGYIYMLTAITADFLAILLQKQSSNVSPYTQLQMR